jgi:hypothetical protein
MSQVERKVPASDAVVLDDVLTSFLIDYLQEFLIESLQEASTAEGTLDDVLRAADRTRQAAPPRPLNAYVQRRRLLEAVGVSLGGSDALVQVGQHFFDSIRSPERMELLQALGSPNAVFVALPELIETLGLAFDLTTEPQGTYSCRIAMRMRGSYEPFPELCAFSLGIASTLPQLFGYAAAAVEQESCQCRGDEACTALLRWTSVGEYEARSRRAAMRSRLIEARLGGSGRGAAHRAGDGLEPVLTRMIAGALRAPDEERPG